MVTHRSRAGFMRWTSSSEVPRSEVTVPGAMRARGATPSSSRSFRLMTSITSTMNITTAGDVTFHVIADDGFLLGFGSGATRVNGTYENAPASNTSPFNGYPLVGAFDQRGGATPATYPVTVHFPAPGTYPYELDYFECCGAQLSLALTVESITPQTSPLSVYVGYADGLRPAGSIFPFPWDGSPNVTFVGCHPDCTFDAGAIRLDNSSNAPMTVNSLSVDLGTCHFAIWPQNLTLPAGGIMIFTQTVNSFSSGCDNTSGQFDTSDIPFAFFCGQSGIIPDVNVTVDGTTTTAQDTQQVLNTGGQDAFSCPGGNESRPWQRIGGGGTPISVPLPPLVSLALAPASVAGDVVGQAQAFTVAAMDGSGQPVPNLPVTLGIFGANTQQLTATTGPSGLASFSYAGAAAGSDTVTATAFISGLQAVSNAASIPWNVPSGGSGATVVSTSGSAPPAVSNLRPAVGALIGAATPVTATITAASGIASWAVTSQAVPSGTVVTLASATGQPPATLATFDPKGLANGTYAITVSATAGGGGRASATNQVFIGSGGGTAQQAGPSISAPAPADGAIVTRPIPITASFAPPAGETIASWSVTYQGQSNPTVVPLASGTGAPPATLATFDPTLLPNDTYTISISATASGGGTQALTSTVSVKGNLKLGRYVTTYRDLSVPVNGFQMDINRTYDSTDKSVGDFGVGWHVSVGNFRTSSNRVLGAVGWSLFPTSCAFLFCSYDFKTSTPHFVTVTFPDTHQEVFDFTPSGSIGLFFFGGSAAFTPRPGTGTTSTLQAAGDLGLSFGGDGNLYASNGQPYDPQQFKLTTHDGRVLLLDRTLGLVSENDRLGNGISVDAHGIHATSGQSITFARDALGRITAITGPTGQSLSYTYSGTGDLASVTTPLGTLTYSYDASHDLLQALGPGGQPVQTLTYDANGRLTGVTNGTGQTVSIANDVAGQKLVLTDPLGQLTTINNLDDLGDVVQREQTFAGQSVIYRSTYDSVGRVLTDSDPLGHSVAYQYDAVGNLTQVTDADGHAEHVTYNGRGQPTQLTDPDGNTISSWTYDAAGNLTQETRNDGSAYSYAHDLAGHLTSVTDPDGATRTLSYDGSGHLAAETDAAGHVTKYSVDASGLVTSVTNPLGATTLYTYDGNRNMLSIQDANGHTQTYSHDVFGNVASTTDADGHTTSYAYDAAQRLTSVLDRNGTTTTYSYDADGRMVSRARGTDISTFSYDPLGRLTGAANAVAQITLAYDAADHLVAESTTGTATSPLPSVTLSHTYDAAGNRLSTSGPAGTTTFSFDHRLRLATVTDPAGGVFGYTYDSLGRLVSLSRPNGVSSTLTYDSANDLLSRVDSLGSTVLAQANYAYNAARLRTSLTDLAGVHTYAYDAANQLVTASHPSSTGLPTESYTYDLAGNRTSPGPATYDAADRLQKDASFTYAYDSEGNLIGRTSLATGAVTDFQWDAAHQLTAVKLPDGTTATYKYDPFGRRLEVDAGGRVTRYVYDGPVIALEYDGANQLTASYQYGPTYDDPLEMTRGGQRNFYLVDGGGSTTALAGDGGHIVQSYSYGAFGQQVSSGTVVNPFTFSGREYDASTQLYYFRQRSYDPNSGRFLEEDPKPAPNLYPYAANDPINVRDTSGADDLAEYEEVHVYVAREEEGCYFGITKDLAVREVRHAGRFANGLFPLITASSRAGARALETFLILSFGGVDGGLLTNRSLSITPNSSQFATGTNELEELLSGDNLDSLLQDIEELCA
jgi:RHS repeat-associated protein